MEEFCILILVAFFVTNSLDKAESEQFEELEELPLQTFDELFVDEWWDKDEADGLKTPAPTNFGQNVHHQIDRQNTQIGQIEPNSTDQIHPLPESDQSDNAINGEELNEITSNENIVEYVRRRKIIDKFHAIKEELKQKGGNVNLAKPHQTINTPTANKRN
uniref:Secreted protein n=1 Tax=Globodera rostochiensis TaxID=31243 RepID=A0A914HBA2_GLORO